MIKNFSFVMAFLCSFFYAQQQFQILDAETQKPIPYAKLILKDKDYYRNAEENGQITLEKDEVISEIQSFGYANFKVEKYQTAYLLKPKFTEIAEVQIARPKLSKSFKIGKVKKTNNFYVAGEIIWSVGKEIKNDISSEPLFLKSLKFYARLNDKKSATIKVNIYYNENGVPKDIYKSYVVTCYRNKKITEFILDKPILFPKEGLIVGFEWIFNKENEYEKLMIFNNEKKKMIAHEPMIGTVEESEKNVIIGHLNNGGWDFRNTSNNGAHKIGNLGIELELTN